MKNKKSVLLLLLVIILNGCAFGRYGKESVGTPEAEKAFLSNVRQFIKDGKRSGEGYFSADGKELTFQSERDPTNPFYQIYIMNLSSGETKRVSPGYGKTTCSWIHPSEDLVLFASTHGDPRSKELQAEELEFRASGKRRPYQWDYDPEFDIYEVRKDGSNIKNLTRLLKTRPAEKVAYRFEKLKGMLFSSLNTTHHLL